MTLSASSVLGVVIGYLGAEVAGVSAFERLLWPERFYNAVDALDLLRLGLFMPMGGPLHRAALETLDKFREYGLYKGRRRGDMLGTAFFPNNTDVHYLHKTASTPEGRKLPGSVRNGFWIEVLKHVDARIGPGGASGRNPPTPPPGDRNDAKATPYDKQSEGPGSSRQNSARTTRRIYRLHLEFLSSDKVGGVSRHAAIDEAFGYRTIIGLFVSEVSSILLAVLSVIWLRTSITREEAPAAWFAGFLCIPLLLKLVAAAARVRREPLVLDENATATTNSDQTSQTTTPSKKSTDKNTLIDISSNPREVELFEVDLPSIGVLLMSTPSPASPASFQFFRHYGHPIRDSTFDRTREIISIATVYAFLLYFPAGLLLVSWMNEPMQYLWLGQQTYNIFAMLVVRLCGWEGASRTEERMAAALARDSEAILLGDSASVRATLQTEEFLSVKGGKKRAQEIVENF
ncbi:hypothetical protein EsH8_III_000071 [Colletotrichum jinshuiense]